MPSYSSQKIKTLFKFPDAIFLDMDDTLYDYQICHNKAMKQAADYLKSRIGMQSAVFRRRYSIARKEINSHLSGTASSHNRLLYFHRLLENCGYGTRVELALGLYNIYWDTFIKNIKIFGGAAQFIKYAKKLSVPIVLVTDLTADIQFKKIKYLNLQNKFNIIVTSEEAGREKPDITIFNLALKKLKCAVKAIWVIGDSIEKDIVGGHSIKAATILIDRKEKYVLSGRNNEKPGLVVRSFHEITNLLKMVQNTHYE